MEGAGSISPGAQPSHAPCILRLQWLCICIKSFLLYLSKAKQQPKWCRPNRCHGWDGKSWEHQTPHSLNYFVGESTASLLAQLVSIQIKDFMFIFLCILILIYFLPNLPPSELFEAFLYYMESAAEMTRGWSSLAPLRSSVLSYCFPQLSNTDSTWNALWTYHNP